MSNPVRTFVLNNMVNFLLALAEFVIVVGTGCVSYYVFAEWFPSAGGTMSTLNFFLIPLLFIVIGTFFIARSCFGVYSMAIDTIYLSFLQDLKQNDGSPEKPYIMEKSNHPLLFYFYLNILIDLIVAYNCSMFLYFKIFNMSTGLQNTVGVMQKFHEENLSRKQQRLQAEMDEMKKK